MRRLLRFFGTAFGVAVLGCLGLAGWALWSAGILDGPIASQVRSSSVYAAPGVDLDQAAAERIVGNRRLVVAFLEPGSDLRDGCRNVKRVADGTVVLLLSHDGDEYTTYGCSLLPGSDDENFGKAFVIEQMISGGINQFVDQPLEALKVVAVNYDVLVKVGMVPDGARTISPSLPRYLIAGAAVAAVVIGATMIYVVAHRAGRVAASRRARRDAVGDARSALSAATAVLAQQIIDLDQHYTRAGGSRPVFAAKYRALVSEYIDMLAEIAVADAHGDVDLPHLAAGVESLTQRCRELADTQAVMR